MSTWPGEKIEALRQVLKGNLAAGPALPQAFDIVRSLPHGAVAAVGGTIHQIGLDVLLDGKASRQRQCVLAMIAGRILQSESKLATARGLVIDTRASTLGEELGLRRVDEDDLDASMDWLLPRQSELEAALAQRHLSEGTVVLYDVTSTYFEGHSGPLAQDGPSREERKNNPPIVWGLLCNRQGCPVAVEVFAGNTGDPQTLAIQLTKLRQRFALKRLVLIGDGGLLTEKRIEEELRPIEGMDWITALRAPQIQKLVTEGVLQRSLFDQRDWAEMTHPGYRHERLVVCRNPLLAEERKRKRGERIVAAEKKLSVIVAATQRQRQPLEDAAQIQFRIGKELGPLKVAKYFCWERRADGLSVERDEQRIALDAALDGIDVLRSSVKTEQATANQTVLAYRRWAEVERAFRSLKSVDLHVRPIHHRLADRLKPHVLIGMLAYYVEWHMRRKLAPLLLDDEHPGQRHGSAVAAVQRSASAMTKAQTKRAADGLPVQSFRDWLQDLATVVRNHIQPKLNSIPPFHVTTRRTEAQQRVFDLLGVSP